MLKKIFIVFILLAGLKAKAQNYNNILNYTFDGIPVNGVKIKTNLPFEPAKHMPNIHISGYNYGGEEPIDLSIIFYIYSVASDFNNPVNYYVHSSCVSSSGSYTPKILLSNENGKVVIYIDDKVYFQRFTVSAFNTLNKTDSWFQGWTAADEVLNGTKTVEIPYRNRFKGDVFLSGSGIWNKNGNVGIGTLTPAEKLAVNGNIRAKEIKVENTNWPDYVFDKEYKLPDLEDTEREIIRLGHLPGIPSVKEVKENGIDLGEMNGKLLKKIEEMTLHLIQLSKENKLQQQAIESQGIMIQDLKSKIK